jgi:hypothetical protein
MASYPPNGSLPGFAWDGEKKKYFQIPKSHLAHSELERQLAQAQFIRDNDLFIAPVHQDVAPRTMAGARASQNILLQDLRLRTDGVSLDTLRKSYLGMCKASNILESKVPRPVIPHHLEKMYDRRWHACAIDWDPVMKTLWSCSLSDGGIQGGVPRTTVKVTRLTSGDGNAFSVDDCRKTNVTSDMFYEADAPPAMAASHGVGLVAMQLEPTQGSLARTTLAIQVVRGQEMDMTLPSSPTLRINLLDRTSLLQMEGHVCLSVTPPSYGSSTALAGLKTGFTRVNLATGQNEQRRGFPSDILSIHWMQPNIGAFGFRNATVLLWDFRASQGAIRLRHSGAVAHLAAADESKNQLIAAGVPDALALYDLRMSRLARSYRSRPANVPESKPIWKAEHSNPDDLGLGFSLLGEVFAAAQDDGTLKMYSTRTGAPLHTFPEPRLSYNISTFRCVKVLEDDLSPMQVLGICAGDILQHGTWEPRSEPLEDGLEDGLESVGLEE